MFRPSVHPSFSSSGLSSAEESLDFGTGECGEKTDAARRCLALGPQVAGQPEQGATGYGDECPPVNH